MALDNAQFISELSITDPPGTDPLSEGDDQIRTAKRTQLQSFPNVDAAVTLTAAQLNDVGIKSDANTWLLVQTFVASLRAPDNTATTPSYGFTNDTGMGMFRQSANNLGFATEGAPRLALTLSQMLVSSLRMRMEDGGTAVLPAISFTDNTDMGMYRSGSNVLGFATVGVERLRISSGNMTVSSNQIHTQDGSAAFPSYAFVNNTNMGMFRSSADVLGFATAGVERFQIAASGITNVPQVEFQSAINTNALTDIVKNITYQRASVSRWQLRMANDTSNPISANDFEVRRFLGGAFVDVPFKIENNRGLISMLTLPNNAGGLSTGMLWRNGTSVQIV